ncbi:MAG: S8 family serine peptidase, partial [Solirubrobacterales bacterium]
MTRVPSKLAAACALALAVAPAVALGAFPGADPHESPRLNTPNDPEFDRCESDDPDTGTGDCATYFEEEFGAFGFSPESANMVPPLAPTRAGHVAAGTRYTDCSQLDAQGREANADAYAATGLGALAECLQIAGVRADTAWKYSTGDPDVAVAVLDSGIRWQERELVDKVRLNAAELPVPKLAGGADCPADDCNGDGAFSVSDFADDPRVANDAGDEEADHLLDGSDLIAVFSDSTDADGNGYTDDIAGWDFFDDDNDPYDASGCCNASGHGTGRAREAVAETDNAAGGVGMCPECQFMPLRVWDTFVVPTDFFAMGVAYAADNGASVVEGAVGGLTNTSFARNVFSYADEKGLALTLVSSDINSANHNYPTNYNEAIYVAGSFPDTAPNDTCAGPGGLPGVDDILGVGDVPGFQDGCEELLGILGDDLGIVPGILGQPTTTSFFRNSNLTQYGGKSDIVFEASTGSQNTGLASGAAALLASYGREVFGDADPLSGNEIRQLLTMTAEDVLPANTGSIGLPDKASAGWDPHFGYGRANLAGAMARIEAERVPPEAQIDSPDWFAPINVDRIPAVGVPVRGHVAAPHSDSPNGVGGWEVKWACGQDAPDAAFAPIPGQPIAGTGEVDGLLGHIPAPLLVQLATSCDGAVTNDAGRPAGTLAEPWPANPYPEPDPERHAFQLRLTAREDGDAQNFGRYRKTLHAYRDDGNLDGWPRPTGTGSDDARYRTGSGGEVSPRLYDIDGDNSLDVLQATSSGELHALRSDGSPVPSFNGGQPVRTDPFALVKPDRLDPSLDPPRESLRVPAIGDIDGDDAAEIVATAGEHVYAWELDGARADGFPAGVDRALSDPCVPGAPHPCFDSADRAITGSNHIKRGFVGSPALADLDDDGTLDIVAGSLDQHVYAFDGSGRDLPGFPAKLDSDGAVGAEIVTTPAIAQLDGEGPPEVIVATNEVVPGDPQFPTSIFGIFNAILSSSTGSNPVYALHGDGTEVAGWPVGVGVAAGDLLPLVLPGHDSAVLDSDGDGDDEVSVSAATSLAGAGGSRLVGGDGATVTTYANAVGNTLDQGPILNLADYTSIGDLSGSGTPLVLKGGLTLNGVVNLLAVNQNLPFSHVEQAWDPATGAAVPGYPRATDDFQLLSQGAVAQVAGGGPARQVLVGTGMYQLHAYGPDGAEAGGPETGPTHNSPQRTGGRMPDNPTAGS